MGKFLLILSLLASTNAFAAINKWVDDQGRVHYSDQPPPANMQPKKLRSDAAAADAAGSGVNATKTFAERDAELKRDSLAKQAEADKAAKKQAAEDARAINCDNAQQTLRSLQSGVRIMDIGTNGERSYIDDTERQQRTSKAQQYISTNCK